MKAKSFLKKITPTKIKQLLRRFLKADSQDHKALNKSIEDAYLNRIDTGNVKTKPLFILAAPRTGSTLLYQLIVKHFDVHYFSNFTDVNFSETPVIGEVLARNLIDFENQLKAPVTNAYGQTEGEAGPSEATRVFSKWFQHQHPSETKSAGFVDEHARENMLRTYAALSSFYGEILVSKNAWNCFRIKALSQLFPYARFIWLRRDIVDSSFSAFRARKKHGDPRIVWNSATPANYRQIKKLTSHQQVVEQQFWTNKAIEQNLDSIDNDNLEVWYEDLLSNPAEVATRISDFLGQEFNTGVIDSFKNELSMTIRNSHDKDLEKITDYANSKYPHLRKKLLIDLNKSL